MDSRVRLAPADRGLGDRDPGVGGGLGSDKPVRRYRVLHVITRLIAGGADENTVLSAVGMDPQRYAVDLAVGKESEPASFALPSHIGYHLVPHLVRDLHPASDFTALIELGQLMWRGRYDLVHTHTAKAGVLGRLAAVAAGVPRVVHTYHGPTFHPAMSAPRRALYIALEKLAAACTHRLIAVGEEVRQSYVKAGIIPRERCSVIYSGMDMGRFKEAGALGDAELCRLRGELGIPVDAVVLGSASRLEKRKGHRYLIDAVARIAAEFPNLHLLIAGDGPLRQELISHAERAGLGNRVHFLGHRHDAERVMAVIDVFVLTSTNEGLPRVLVQAAAMAKPIVAFSAPGVREVVVDGRNGYVVDVGDVDGVVAHLRHMVRDPEAARVMGLQGPLLVDERWSVSRMVGDLGAVYEELLEAA